jgi:Co/Zn/Cd efflux system component
MAEKYNIDEINHDTKDNRKSLKIVFYIHMVMFVVVLIAAIKASSSALLADSLDFIGDAASYALSLYVLNKSGLFKAGAAIIKALTMVFFGVPMLVYAIFQYDSNVLPNYEVMSVSGLLAICAHLVCIYYLNSFRNGDSNLLSVWVCTINDLLSNTLTIIAAFLVHITGTIMPDVIAAVIIVSIALYGAFIILRQALKEIKQIKFNSKYHGKFNT